MFTRSLAVTLVLLAPVCVRAQAGDIPVLTIAVDGPVYAGQPAWVQAVGWPTRNIRYPFSELASDLGCNRLEVKRDGVLLTPAPVSEDMQFTGIMCGSAAPPGSPEQRLPLHILYPLTKPGKYTVRWTMENSYFFLVERPDFHPVQPLDSHPVQHPGLPGVQSAEKQRTIAQSDWLTFEVLASTPEQHEVWLKNLLAIPPEDAGHLAGDFLPSLIAAAPDQRALNMLVKYLHSPDQMVSGMASSALDAFPQTVVLPAVVETLVKDGPSDELAQFVTMHRGWTLADENRIVHAAIPYLLSMGPMQPVGRQRAQLAQTQSAAALKLLGYIFYVPNHVWPESVELRDSAEAEVMKAAAKIMADGNAVAVQQLALFLGEMKYSPQAHEVLLQIAQRTDGAAEQARICLSWHPQPDDLAMLAVALMAPGDADTTGRDRASLPYHLVQGYGDAALPYLEKAVAESPYMWVRVQSAEQLGLKNRPAGFQFILDAIVTHQRYKQELIQWVKNYFGARVARDATEEQVVVFLREKSAN